MLLWWSIAYLVVIGLWALLILRRSGPTLWKGSSLILVNGLFVAGATISTLWADGINAPPPFPISLIVFDVVLIALAVLLRNTWLLLGATAADSQLVLERCFKQTRSSPTRRDDNYVVQCGECEMTVGIKPNAIALGGISVRLPGQAVRFSGGGDSKKAGLIRDLFCKQFHRSLPTPRIKA